MSKIVFILLVLLTEGREENRQQGKIPIGAIFDWDDKEARTGFLFAMNRFNTQPGGLFNFSALIDVIDVKDSFTLASSICSHMATGVFMLLGARKFESSNIVRAYTQTFHIPYVSPTVAHVLVPNQTHGYQLYLKPPHTKALADIIRHYNWKHFHFVYDSEQGLFGLQEILRYLNEKDFQASVKIRRLTNITDTHEDLRALDRLDQPNDTKKNKYIVLELSTESAYNSVLKQIREVGMNKEGYYYILGTLDFMNLDLERYQHGGVNITGFQLVNYTAPFVKRFLKLWRTLNANIWHGAGNNSIHIDAALVYDAITTMYNMLTSKIHSSKQAFKHTFRRGVLYNFNKTKGVPCNTTPPIPWMHGESLMSKMKQLRFKGVTGFIAFNEQGIRKEYKLGVYNVGLNAGPNKIGEWTPKNGLRSAEEEKVEVVSNVTLDKVYRVTSILDEPFLMELEATNGDGVPHVGEARYEGFCVDFTKAVADYVHFQYSLRPVRDNKYGKKVTINGTWDGMIGELLNDEADLAVAPLSITADREEMIDFSKPFMNSGISIMIKKPEKKKPGVFSFMQPFTLELWLCIVIGYVCVGVGIFLVSRFSPAEWRRNGNNNVNDTYNKFTLANSLWFAMGSLMLQGSDDTCPRSASGRIIGGAWWFVVLICISSYTANLAAFLTIEKMLTPIESADDLVAQNEIAYGTLDSGSTQIFFQKSRVQTYRAMHYYMSATEPPVYVKTIDDGIRRVRESKGKYAFLMESVYNEYANNRKPCDTMKVGPNLNSIQYGIATPKGSTIRDEITFAVLSLKEDGTLQKMKDNWWIDKGECGFNTGHRESKKRSLSLSNVAGIYFILVAGLVLAIIIGVVEFIYFKGKPDRVPPGPVYLMATDTAMTFADGNHVTNHEGENGASARAYSDNQHSMVRFG